MDRRRIVGGLLVLAGLGGLLAWQAAGPRDEAPLRVAVDVPSLSPAAKEGARLFSANCASCHGENAGGSSQGPPLVHKIYEPSHHGDAAFVMAVTRGVRPHHWGFGPMPPVPGLGEREVARIVAYVRELQRANGIR